MKNRLMANEIKSARPWIALPSPAGAAQINEIDEIHENSMINQ